MSVSNGVFSITKTSSQWLVCGAALSLGGLAAACGQTPSAPPTQPVWRALGGPTHASAIYNVHQKRVLAALQASNAGAVQNSNTSNQGTAPPDEIGPDYRVWRLGSGTTSAASRHHRVVEIASGMNYWAGSQWSPSDATFEATPAGDAFVATRVQHSVRIASNLNTPAAVIVGDPSADQANAFQCTPVAIALYDSAGGGFAVIGNITDCSGTLVSSNTIIFPNAFQGVCADVVFTLERGSFQQDVVITGRVDPADYGFPPATTRIQVISEFYATPHPERLRRPLRGKRRSCPAGDDHP